MDNQEKIAFTSYNSPFLNTDCLFIEYDDVIRSPSFMILQALLNTQALSDFFQFEIFSSYDTDELFEWYYSRKYKNILWNIPLKQGILENTFKNDVVNFYKWCDVFINQETNSYPEIFLKGHLNFYNILSIFAQQSMVKKIYVWSEFENNAIRDDIDKSFGSKVSYVFGLNLQQLLVEHKISSNSTFVFSNINNITSIKDADLLNYSSIVLAEYFGYNYDKNKYNINIDKLREKYLFKFDTFDNLTSM